jgi:hypothetical protein
MKLRDKDDPGGKMGRQYNAIWISPGRGTYGLPAIDVMFSE